MHSAPVFDQTTGSIARLSEASVSYIIELARSKKIPSLRTSDGRFLFSADVAARVRELKAEGMRRRGHRRPSASERSI